MAQNVWKVNLSGAPGTFFTVQAAIDAASDGDVVLIGSSYQAGFEIDGKALTLVVEPGAITQFQASCTIRNIPFGKSVVLIGLPCATSLDTGAGGHVVSVIDTLGAVRLESCQLAAAISKNLIS